MDGSPPGSSVHGISQGRIPEWVAIPFSRGSSRPRDGIRVDSLWFEPPGKCAEGEATCPPGPGRGMGSGLTIYSSCGEGQSKWNQGRRVEGGLSTGKSELDGG